VEVYQEGGDSKKAAAAECSDGWIFRMESPITRCHSVVQVNSLETTPFKTTPLTNAAPAVIATKRQFWYQTIGLLIVYCGNPGSWDFQRFLLVFASRSLRPQVWSHACSNRSSVVRTADSKMGGVVRTCLSVDDKALWAGAACRPITSTAVCDDSFLFLISSFSLLFSCLAGIGTDCPWILPLTSCPTVLLNAGAT
jgi:hypothetical protein